jgi:peptidoglycan/xylan/chitin deacetylase (PgdA/CDA1 family)
VADLTADPYGLAVSPGNFAGQLDYLRQTCRPMRLLELAQCVERGSLPDRAVAVTFDDGYVDNLTNAQSRLQFAGIPATVFVTTGWIDSPREFWWDELEQLLLLPVDLPDRLDLCVRGRDYHWSMTSPKKRRRAHLTVHGLLRPLDATEREHLLEHLRDWAGLKPTTRPDYRPMTGEELRKLAGDGMVELGAHTVTHPVLSALSPEEQSREIAESRRTLEVLGERSVLAHAHPYGRAADFSLDTIRLVKAHGFRVACTGITGSIEAGDDLFGLRRCVVRNWKPAAFERFLEGYFLA